MGGEGRAEVCLASSSCCITCPQNDRVKGRGSSSKADKNNVHVKHTNVNDCAAFAEAVHIHQKLHTPNKW